MVEIQAGAIEKIIQTLSFESSPLAGQENVVIVSKAKGKDSYYRDAIKIEDALAALQHLTKKYPDKKVAMGFALSTPKISGAATDSLIFTLE